MSILGKLYTGRRTYAEDDETRLDWDTPILYECSVDIIHMIETTKKIGGKIEKLMKGRREQLQGRNEGRKENSSN